MRRVHAAFMVAAAVVAMGADAAPQGGLSALNEKFGIGEKVRFVAGEGGLACAEIHTAACTGRVYLQGGHVAAWQPAGEEPVLMMSSKSAYAEGKAMRGGVPVVFPWFAGKADDAKAPGHGLVRTMAWTVEGAKEEGGNIVLTLAVKSDAATKQWWAGDFEVREIVTMGKELSIELRIKNTGSTPFTFEDALHSYFAVSDIGKVQVEGLDGVTYIDKVDGRKEKTQAGAIGFAGETDRIYLKTGGPLTVVDGGWKRKVQIEKQGSGTTVVWNVGGTKAVADFGPEDWHHYVCVETANLKESGGALTAAPGEEKRLAMHVRVEK
jgi:glucose-6-phosphate 1-epimerase